VRNPLVARQELRRCMEGLRSTLQSNSHPYSVMMLGSIDRGNRVFRYSNWESSLLYQQLQQTNHARNVPIAGLYGQGVFTILDDAKTRTPAVMEAATLYAMLSTKQTTAATVLPTTVEEEDLSTVVEDVMTKDEVRYFSDINEAAGVLVSKRDTDSSHSVRVATMEFYVPEKIPQPANVLESMVWDREKEIDRFRERFQLTRALLQVKAASAKVPSRDLLQAMTKSTKTPVILEIVKDSLYRGSLAATDANLARLVPELITAASVSTRFELVALGTNTDSGIYKGSYEDLELVRSSAPATMPIICNDFIVYAYQIFQAKIKGADVIKLYASILPIQELNYLSKIAKAFGMTSMILVASKQQLLSVLDGVKDLQAIAITNRNHKLWKLQPGKIIDILDDAEVQVALNKTKADQRFVMIAEGFASSEEVNLIEKRIGKDVDALLFGEEMIHPTESLVHRVQAWLL
jgi:indole-3-glycerol phosphate synthase